MDQPRTPQLIKALGPEPPEKKRRPRELAIFILPNLLTTANLFCGYFSIVASIREQWVTAAFAIALAGLFDALDGRIARLTKTQSAFGEQYDSMSDLVSFGVAPALLMHQWALVPYGRIGWAVSFLYLTCAALRLARFNVFKQNVEKRYFQGLASPIAAGTIAAAVLFYLDMGFSDGRDVYMLFVMASLATLMISQIPFRSFKDLRFDSQFRFGVALIVVAALVLLVAHPEKVLFPVVAMYVVSGPVGWCFRMFRKRGGRGAKTRKN